MTETEQPQTNGLDGVVEEDENNITRPADIEQDMREMERRKRVEAIMCSRLFREELERIVDGQLKDGPSTIMQQISDMMGVPVTKVGSIFRGSSCVIPINDIRGVEAMGYEKGEKILRCKLAATFRLLEFYGYSTGIQSIVTARLNADQELFLVNPYGLLFHEVTASSLNKVNMQGFITEQGTTNFGINTSQFILHSVIHAARPDIRCIINVGHNAVVAVSSTKQGLLPLTKDAAVLGEIAIHNYSGALNEPEEREKLVRSLGPMSKVLLLTNHGALCCGETIEEAFYGAQHMVKACEAQLNLLPAGLDNLVLIPEETRKAIYDASRKPPESIVAQDQTDNKDKPAHQGPKWRVGGAEFEALMRMMDNAGFRTGYIYRNPLVKHEVPKPKNDVEVPPAVSSLGYLLEEEELYRQGIWKKGVFKAGDRTRWLNSPNVYQKVEVLETGTSDPKKITKWVDTQAEEWVVDGSPTHSTPVKIDSALQFVPTNTNPKEFKRIQQQIKDYRRADKISAGPQSHILEGVTWDEANRLKDANVTKTGDHVVLMGAASKGIIQRGYQHNATVYKAPYAKNPFDSVTDDELNEYKRTVEKKRTGDYTDTDFSESEALSSLPVSGQVKSPVMSPPSQSEPEDAEHVVMRIETKQAPKPSQPEVVLSDVNADFLSNEKYESVVTGKPPKKGKERNTNTDGQRKNKKVICSLNDLSGTLNSRLAQTKPSNSKKSIQVEPFFSPIPTQTKCFNWLSENLPDLEFMSCKSASQTNSMYKYCDTFPYRTNSHFGFNSPTYTDPQHFHLPCSPNKFVPLRRSKSFEELFCTDKYLNLPGGQIPLKILSAIRRKFLSPQYKSKSSRVLFKDDIQKPSVEKAIQTDCYMHDMGTQCQEPEWIEGSIYYDSCPTMANSDYSLPDDAFMLTASAPSSLAEYTHRPRQITKSNYMDKWNEFIQTGRHELLVSMLNSDGDDADGNNQDYDNCGAVPVYRTYAEFFDSGPENGEEYSGEGTLSAQTSNLSMQTVIENIRLNSSSSREFMEKCIGVENYPMLDDERLTLVSETSRNPASLVSGPSSLLENSPPLNEVDEAEEQHNSLDSMSSVHSGHDYKHCTKCDSCLRWQKWYNSADSKKYKRKRKQAALKRKNLQQASEQHDEEIVTLNDDENPTSDQENVWTIGTSSSETTPRNSNDTIVNVVPANVSTVQAEVHSVPNQSNSVAEHHETCSSCAINDGLRKRYVNIMQDAHKFAEENFVPKDFTPTKSKYEDILDGMKIIPNILKRKLSPCSKKLLVDVNVKFDDDDELDDTLKEMEVQVNEEPKKPVELLERIEEVDENIIASPLELKLERQLAQVLKEAEEERRQKQEKENEICRENFEEIISVSDELPDTDDDEEKGITVLFDRKINEQTLNNSREDVFWKDVVSETEDDKLNEQEEVIDLDNSQENEYFEDSLDMNLSVNMELPTIVINDSYDSQIDCSLETSEVYSFVGPEIQQKNSTPEENAAMGCLVELTPISPVRKSLVDDLDKKLEELNNQKCGETFMRKIQDFDYSKESPAIVTGNEILASPDTEDQPIGTNNPDEYSKVWDKIPFINFNHSNGIDRVLNERESGASSLGNGPDLSGNVEAVITETNPDEKSQNNENLDAGTDLIENKVCTSTPHSGNASLHTLSHISVSSDDSEVKSFHTPKLLQSMEEKPTNLFDLNNSKENIDVDGYFSDVSDTRYSNRYKRVERKHFRHSVSKSASSKSSMSKQLKPKRDFINENVKRIACISASKISNSGSIFCKTNPFKTTPKRNDMISSFQSQKQKLWVTFNAERKPLSQKYLEENTMTPNKTPVSGKKIAKKIVETSKTVNSGTKQKTPKLAMKTDSALKSKEKSKDVPKTNETPKTSKPSSNLKQTDMSKVQKVKNGNGRKSNRRNSMRLLKAKNILKVPKSVINQNGTKSKQVEKVPSTPVGVQVTPKFPRVNLDDYSTPKTISPVKICPSVTKKTGNTPICENRKIRRRIFDVNENGLKLKKTPQKSDQKTLPNSSGNSSKSSTAPKIVKMITKPITVKPTVAADVLEAQRRFMEGEAADTVSLASTSSDRSVRIEMFRNAFIESEKRMSEIKENAHVLCKELDGITFENGFRTSTESSTEFLELEKKMNERLSEQVDNRHRLELMLQLQDKQILEQQRQYIEDESKIRTNQLDSLNQISDNLAKCLSSKDGLVGKLDDKIKKLDTGIGECVKIQGQIEEDRQNVESSAASQMFDGMDFKLKESDD